MPKLHTSRRVTGLKESDYDHEIDLVDHDSPPASPRPISRDGNAVGESSRGSGEQERPSRSRSSRKGKAVRGGDGLSSKKSTDESLDVDQGAVNRGPSIEIQEATPYADADAVPEPEPEPSTRDDLSKISTTDRESVIDILYENERGGWLCGIPLFSSKALGNLDPTPWTNAFHKASPTDIHTAQVPDPTWEWAWPEWRLHRLDDIDEGGWEYSFMFAKKFSWHGPRWWNSFVRRRAWIRKRVKKRLDVFSSRNTDPHMLNADYFTVQPASDRSRSRSPTRGTSPRRSGTSIASQVSDPDAGFDVSKQRIDDVDSLLYVLRRARIDREKLEAVGVYLEKGTDLSKLQGAMHDIMIIFIFQASRKLLLSNLTSTLDETIEALEAEESRELKERRGYLEAAVKCADEEVRKLAYWSDIKGMVEGGESAHAVTGEGWGGEWEGVDQSGPAGPRKEDGGS